jgi:formylglycine-generating enzyme required for sulfatase activity
MLDPMKNWRTPGFEQSDDHPVVCISWNDAVALCEWLTKQVGQGWRFRLPTEAEWEYACRAGTTTPFYFGETISTDQANYNGTSLYGTSPYGTSPYGKWKQGVYRGKTTPVDNFPANAWGLKDMHGNVQTWCQDRYGLYSSDDNKDPQGDNVHNARVMRGGSWHNGPWNCRSARRDYASPDSRFDFYGCRVLLFQD